METKLTRLVYHTPQQRYKTQITQKICKDIRYPTHEYIYIYIYIYIERERERERERGRFGIEGKGGKLVSANLVQFCL